MSFSIGSDLGLQVGSGLIPGLGGSGLWPYIWSETAGMIVAVPSGVRWQTTRLPVTLRSFKDRSNGGDMDALIKSIRQNKPDAKSPEVRSPDMRPAELDPSEFLAAAVRATQPRPSRAEA